jgi:hypothetical protein
MDTPRRQRLRRTGLKSLLFLAAPLIAMLALPAAPASASTTHDLRFVGDVDIKDDDPGADDWCYGQRVAGGPRLTHSHRKDDHRDWVTCDEVRIEVKVTGELMSDDRICNIVLDVYLYEGLPGGESEDLDGHTFWKGGTGNCLQPGQFFRWDVVRVDNTAENAPDHGWVRNLRISHT